MSDLVRDGAALALAVARGDRDGTELLFRTVDDVWPPTWWLAVETLRVAPPGMGVIPVIGERAWRATVADLTAHVAVVTDDALDAAEEKATDTGGIVTQLLRSIAAGDTAATRQLRRDVPDWRGPARFLSVMLVEAMTEAGEDAAATLRENANHRSTIEALDRDIARRLAELPPDVADDITRRFEDDE